MQCNPQYVSALRQHLCLFANVGNFRAICVTLVKGQGVEIFGIQLLEEVFFLNECPFGLQRESNIDKYVSRVSCKTRF